jgi:predicted XRE-type DNA-binding protein
MLKAVSNPFELFATDSVELNILSLKSKLMIIISSLIRTEGWSQHDAAKRLGVKQPRISNLMHGHVSKFSLDGLIEMLCRIGFVIDMNFRPHDSENPLQVSVKKAVV